MEFMDFSQFESFSSGPKWEQGGWVFIKGVKNKENKNYLFVAPIKYLDNLARQKSSGNPGSPANMVTFYPEFYGIGMGDYNVPIAVKVPSDLEYLKKWVGISNYNVVLNNNKTPFWRVTAVNKNLRKILNDHTSWFINDRELILPRIIKK